MDQNDRSVEHLRAAIEDRALYLALLYRSFAKALPSDQADKLAREAIYEYGQVKGRLDGKKLTPDEWMDRYVADGGAAAFGSQIIRDAEYCEDRMTYCPLLEAWKKLGCGPRELDLLCDIAMEVDRGRAAYHGIPVDIPMRMGRGDPVCRLILKKTRGT